MTMNRTATHYDGPVPDAVVEDLSKGAVRYEKRIVKSMTAESRIVELNGSIRAFDDFKNDWRYDRSVYGTTDTCGVCGKHPIKENCVLVDDHTGQELIVGNTCVHRYIEIELDGVRLTGEKKKVFLKEKMSAAKKAWKKNEWTRQHSRAQERLDEFEEWMTETTTWRKRPVNPALNTLHRGMTKRLSKHGFPGPKMWAEWEDFLVPRTGPTAAKRHAIWVIETRRREEDAEMRRMAEEDRKARFAANAAWTRAEWKKEADEWCGTMNTRDLGFNSWELNMIERVRVQWRLGGRPLGDSGMTRFMAEAETKLAIRDGSVTLNDEAAEAATLLKVPKLNSWERGFLTSILVRLQSDRPLSDKQRHIYDGMKKKHEA